jgi:hypothetical protein
MSNPKLLTKVKQLYRLFENEVIHSINEVKKYYEGIYEISDLILKDLILETNVDNYISELHLALVELDEIPVLINHIKLFTGIHIILSSSIDIEKKDKLLKNSFFDINFDFHFLQRHYLLQVSENEFEREVMSTKGVQLKQIHRKEESEVIRGWALKLAKGYEDFLH